MAGLEPPQQFLRLPAAPDPELNPRARSIAIADHMIQSLADFAAAIIADEVVDTEEVRKICECIYADGVVDWICY